MDGGERVNEVGKKKRGREQGGGTVVDWKGERKKGSRVVERENERGSRVARG